MSDTSTRRKDGTTSPFNKGDMIVYIPKDLLMGDRKAMIRRENLGVVRSKNDRVVFVRFIDTNNQKGVAPGDLYFIHHRQDLEQALINSFTKNKSTNENMLGG
jgi:hypothetical protein